jgi:hypothetical protein
VFVFEKINPSWLECVNYISVIVLPTPWECDGWNSAIKIGDVSIFLNCAYVASGTP